MLLLYYNLAERLLILGRICARGKGDLTEIGKRGWRLSSITKSISYSTN